MWPSQDALLRGFAWCALIIATFILAHPYAGIVHDNVLYFAQAFLRLNPDIYRGDVFFQWGSQDRYTLFSPIYAWLILHFGLNTATVTLLLLSQALFLAASFALVRVLIPSGLRGFAMVFIVSSIGLYGGHLLFRMAEPFVTPRAFVEGATLFAIVLLVCGRRGWALTLLAMAALLHPLIALAGMVYCWLYLVLEDRRWLWLIAVGIVPAVAGLAGIAPFTQLFQSFDEKWLAILTSDNANIFVTLWTHYDWGMLVFDGAVLVIAMHFAEGVSRHAFKTALLTAVATLTATFIFSDLLHNVLLASIQPWRALWIVHWMAAASLAFVTMRLWSAGPVARLIAGLLVFGFVTRGLTTSFAASILAVLLFHYRHRISINIRIATVALCALAAGAFTNWAVIALRVYQVAPVDSVTPITDFVIRALSKPLPLLVFATAVAWFGLRRQHRSRVTAFVAAAFVLLSVTVWDQRMPFMAYIDSTAPGSHPFSRIVAPHQQVFWHGNATAPWIMMQRRSYYSDMQTAGQVFNRDMTMELARRREAIVPLMFQEQLCKLINSLNNSKDSCEPDLDAIRGVCQDANDLDFIVLDTPIANQWVASWTWPVPVAGRRSHYYLYECKLLRSQLNPVQGRS